MAVEHTITFIKIPYEETENIENGFLFKKQVFKLPPLVPDLQALCDNQEFLAAMTNMQIDNWEIFSVVPITRGEWFDNANVKDAKIRGTSASYSVTDSIMLFWKREVNSVESNQ